MEILGGFEFDDGEAVVAGDAQQIDDSAVGCGKGGHLWVEHGGVQARIQQGDVTLDDRLQPALGLQAIEGIGVIAADALEQEAPGQLAE